MTRGAIPGGGETLAETQAATLAEEAARAVTARGAAARSYSSACNLNPRVGSGGGGCDVSINEGPARAACGVCVSRCAPPPVGRTMDRATEPVRNADL